MKVLAAIAVAVIGVVVFTGAASAQGVYVSTSVGSDMSWPNCNARVPSTTAFGIVGVTDGLGYSTNPCLGAESAHFANLSLYVNTGWYSGSSHVSATSPRVCAAGDNGCLAYNYGYNAGLYAADASANAGVRSATWWLDVETGNTWSSDTVQNQDSLQGEHDALMSRGATVVGAYSTTYQWGTITGGWVNNWPSWGATTVRTAKQAKTYCAGHQFTGGSTWLIQFTGQLDQDYAC